LLSTLAIHHFAIIRRLEVAFQPGFNLISGETGAGKSILVGAVNLILGSRASQELIQTGAHEASVEVLFDLPERHPARQTLTQWDLNADDQLVIRRSISRGGRNRVWINGQLVTLQQLQQLAPGLLSISGQHEHQLLLNPDTHLQLLDAVGQLEAARDQVTGLHAAITTAQEKLQKLRKSRADRAAHQELLQFQLQELEAAQLQPQEDDELERERNLLKHAATLAEAAHSAHDAVYGKRGAVLEELGRVHSLLETICGIDGEQKPLLIFLEQGRLQLEELAHALQQYARRLPFDPQRLAAIEDRLAILQRLSKKYGGRVADLLERVARIRTELTQGEVCEAEEQQLEMERDELRHSYIEKALALSQERQRVAVRLAEQVQQTLAALDMARARFAIKFQREACPDPPAEQYFAPSGMDLVEFMLSANPGEDLKPLAKVASGGELSRILLALKSLLSVQGQAETLIFDEVDAGIGGRTAELVGRQLQHLAARHQVICITHLPQIACYAQHHYRVVKHTDGKETVTHIEPLSDAQRVEELARMLGGLSISDKTLAHARELLENSVRRQS
jgi:DNA repair protein RecN (Recombination protein N)